MYDVKATLWMDLKLYTMHSSIVDKACLAESKYENNK